MKLCIDCRWHKKNKGMAIFPDECTNPKAKAVSPVTGKHVPLSDMSPSCETQRKKWLMTRQTPQCGHDGAWFEPKA